MAWRTECGGENVSALDGESEGFECEPAVGGKCTERRRNKRKRRSECLVDEVNTVFVQDGLEVP